MVFRTANEKQFIMIGIWSSWWIKFVSDIEILMRIDGRSKFYPSHSEIVMQQWSDCANRLQD